MSSAFVSTRVYPAGMLNTLSRSEVERLQDVTRGELAELVRRCSLAVLNSGNESDDAEALLEQYRDFRIEVQQVNRGLRLQLSNAPGSAFVEGQIIEGIREQLSAVVRDLVYFDSEIRNDPNHDLGQSEGISGAVFEVLRNAGALIPEVEPDLVVCWGGHSIARNEYEYTKSCGYEMGLRRLNIITGCGPGAMKGPMKGATIAHSKQRKKNGRYIGVSEPGIIAAESPNPIVNNLVIMPDIEKRLHREATGGLCAPRSWHRRFSGGRRDRGGNPLPARYPAQSSQCRYAVPGGVHRAFQRGRLFPPNR
jgi:hypothetical protein